MKIQKYLQVGNKTLPIYQKQGKQKKGSAKERGREWRVRNNPIKTASIRTPEEYKAFLERHYAHRRRYYATDPRIRQKVTDARRLARYRKDHRETNRVKTCSICLEEKPYADFNERKDSPLPKNYTTPRYECKKCRSKKNAQDYQRNKLKRQQDQRIRNQENKEQQTGPYAYKNGPHQPHTKARKVSSVATYQIATQQGPN